MFQKERYFLQAFFVLVLFVVAIMNSGCEVEDLEPEIEPDDPSENDEMADEPVEEIINDDLLFILPVNSRNLIEAPLSDYLLFTNGGTQFEPYSLIKTQTYEADFCDQRNAYWGEVEELPTPGLEGGRAYSPQFSPDGDKLLYIGYGFKDHDEFGAGTIYLSSLDLPPQVTNQVILEEDDLLRGIKPAWKADQQGIYFITARGVMDYCSLEEQTVKLYPTGELSGLVQEGSIAPHTFYVEEDMALLAYFHDGFVRMVPLENTDLEPEVFRTGLSDIGRLEFIFGGRYLVLESIYTFDFEGHWLQFLDLQSGEIVEIDNKYLPLVYEKKGYAKTAQGEIVLNQVEDKGLNGLELNPALIDSNLEKVRALDLPSDIIRFKDKWCVIESEREGTFVYQVKVD